MAGEPTPSGKPEGNAPQEGSHFRHGGRGGVGLGAAVAGDGPGGGGGRGVTAGPVATVRHPAAYVPLPAALQ